MFCARARFKEMRQVRSCLRGICAPIDLAANLHSLTLAILGRKATSFQEEEQ